MQEFALVHWLIFIANKQTDMNLWFMRCVNEREQTIWQFITVDNKLKLAFHAFDNFMTKFMIKNRRDIKKLTSIC